MFTMFTTRRIWLSLGQNAVNMSIKLHVHLFGEKSVFCLEK